MKIYLDTTDNKNKYSRKALAKNPVYHINITQDLIYDEDELDKLIRFRNANKDKEFILITNNERSRLSSWLKLHFNFTKIINTVGGKK